MQFDLFSQPKPAAAPAAVALACAAPLACDPTAYDRVCIAFSGGKDSLACVLAVLAAGVPAERIELHHHDIDGGGESFMDWPITRAYCAEVAAALGLRILFSAKEGGFQREMLRENSLTAPMIWDRLDGSRRHSGGERGKLNTRRRFPQTSDNLSVRWCSAYLKIDVLAALIRNEPRFTQGKTLIVTGERAQESSQRATYKAFEPHRTDSRYAANRAQRRRVDHWRPVLAWTESQIWEAIKRSRIVPHPAYYLGWARLSCRTCIFGSPSQWATVRAVYPEAFARIAARETEFGTTINRTRSIGQMADRGTPYPAALANPEIAALADSESWPTNRPVRVTSEADWLLPAGAYGENAGPT